MSFLYPHMLWLFAALPALMALYLLRVRPMREPVTAFFLWEEIFGSDRRSALWGRLRNLIGLLLMLLASTLAILAASGFHFGANTDDDIVMIIDGSASMRAETKTAVGNLTTRFEKAKKKSREIISSLSPFQSCTLALAGNGLNVPGGFTSSRKALVETLDRFNLGFSESSLTLFDNFRMPAKQSSKKTRLLYITDAAFGNEKLPDGIELVRIDDNAENIGICGLDIMQSPSNKNALVWCRFSSTVKDRKINAELVVYHTPEESQNENLVKVLPLELEKGISDPILFTVTDAGVGKWRLELESKDISDALKEDNSAFWYLPPPKPATVSVNASETHNFFAHAVEAFRQERLGLTVKDNGAEIEIYAGTIPDFKPGMRYIVFAPPAVNDKSIGKISGKDLSGNARKLLDKHSAGRFLDFEGRRFGGVKPVKVPEGTPVLFNIITGEDNSETVPLIYKAYPNGATVWVCNFNPLYGHFILSPYFPVLIKSLSEDLLRRGDAARHCVRPGDLFPERATLISAPYNLEEFPERNSFSLPGIYIFKTGDSKKQKQYIAACSLLSDRESLLNNHKKQDADKAEKKKGNSGGWLLAAALLLFVFEEILYHRRKVD